MAAEENRFAPDLTEDEVIKLLENATSGNTKKATKYMYGATRLVGYLSSHIQRALVE